MAPPPLVTGISPKDGLPGTEVKIRGDNLGIDERDFVGLRIGNVDCYLSATWKTPSLIVARTAQAKDKCEIIITTKSGGVGSCTVHFRGYNVQIGPLQESAVWVNETQSLTFSRNRAMSPTSPGDDQDDLLGICDESNNKKIPDQKLSEIFAEGSGNIALENFDPAWYLFRNHHQASFDDLRSGLSHLKMRSSQRGEGQNTFVKENLPTFMDCFDTLADMYNHLSKDQRENVGGITHALLTILGDGNNEAAKLFHDILKRKDRADSTRTALALLNRFKFLFNLPTALQKNIKKGDYDQVITDFNRAWSLFRETKVKIFRKVYQEVERIIADFRYTLFQAAAIAINS